MTSTRLLTVAGAVLAAFVSMTSTSLAQTATGQITGTVRDASGAVMPGVKVAVTNEQTGLTRQTITGANGEYVIPLLPVGVYVVTGEQTGFKTAIHTAVALTVDQIQRVDMQLAAGTVSETVEVQSNALMLDTGKRSASATRLPRSRSPICRSTAATSCNCSSSALGRWRPVANREGCGKGWAMRSASWVPARRRTTS